jgi:hypothetical protein
VHKGLKGLKEPKVRKALLAPRVLKDSKEHRVLKVL